MDGIHSYGINSVRIPVAWSNMMSDDGKYTINDAYFNRVETVMNYAFKNDMYVMTGGDGSATKMKQSDSRHGIVSKHSGHRLRTVMQNIQNILYLNLQTRNLEIV